MPRSNFDELKPKSVLCVAAHPDDLEFGAAGSVAKWARGGAKVYYLILTNGNKGSEDRSLSPDQLRNLRRKEQRAAAKILGVSSVTFLDYEDGLLTCDAKLKRDIVRTIREVKPDTVVTMDPTLVYSVARGFVNHPDHRAAGQATLDAVYPLARDWRSFPEIDQREKLKPHKARTLLLINFDTSNYYEDITATIDTKLKALSAHASQLPDREASLGLVREWARAGGRANGVDYAEAFVRLDLAA